MTRRHTVTTKPPRAPKVTGKAGNPTKTMDSYLKDYHDPYQDEEEDTSADLPGDTSRLPTRETPVASDMAITSEDTETGERQEPRATRHTPSGISQDTTELIRMMSAQMAAMQENTNKMFPQLARSQDEKQEQLIQSQREQQAELLQAQKAMQDQEGLLHKERLQIKREKQEQERMERLRRQEQARAKAEADKKKKNSEPYNYHSPCPTRQT